MSMRTVAGSLASLVLALVLVVSTGGAAWASFTGSTTGAVRAATLQLQPPTNLAQVSCSGGRSRTLTVSFTATTSIPDVAARPARTPALVLTYSAVVAVSGSNTTTTTVAADATQFDVNRNNLSGGPKTWTVTMQTTYAGWTSAPVTVTLTC